ncbi:MAG: cytochrome c oxidase assembly protein [Bradymonadaceae bacterium]|nr:cytochrome c oxidase assembly protein [Lujinxingiaceae bacterium]
MAIGVIVGMFLFGFASIPLYRLVCLKYNPGGSTWFNGKSDPYVDVEIDTSRTVRVRFATNVERQLPWDFSSSENFAEVHPGEKRLIKFNARNQESFAVKGKAVYDINPPEAGQHFRKIECFCFIEQTLAGNEHVEMPLYFWFDSELPAHVKEITIAYTFFNGDSSMARSIQNRRADAR